MIDVAGSLNSIYNYENRVTDSKNVHDIKRLKNQALSKNDTKLKKVCSEFEAIFIKQMLDSMRKTINKSGLLDGGMGEKIFEDMLYDKYADKMSSTAHFGLKDILYKQLSNVS